VGGEEARIKQAGSGENLVRRHAVALPHIGDLGGALGQVGMDVAAMPGNQARHFGQQGLRTGIRRVRRKIDADAVVALEKGVLDQIEGFLEGGVADIGAVLVAALRQRLGVGIMDPPADHRAHAHLAGGDGQRLREAEIVDDGGRAAAQQSRNSRAGPGPGCPRRTARGRPGCRSVAGRK